MKQSLVKKIKSYYHTLGPGLTTGAADDDPSGITTYSQTGAQFGTQLAWLAPITFPLMAIIQEMCARIGLVTGRGLAANIKRHYPKKILYAMTMFLFIANTINIGADLGAMVKATQLLIPHADFNILMLGFVGVSLMLQIFVSYHKYSQFLKYLTFTLVTYVAVALSIDIDWATVLRQTAIPSLTFSKDQILLICAILGTTISPYLFFWQTSQEIEEEIAQGKTTLKERQITTQKDIKNMRLDVWSGMFVSNVIMFFIIVACAATLNAQGITSIETAADAANALRPIAGENAYLLFTLGIIGTGLLAIPVLAGSSSYAIAESFGWKEGLYKKFRQATSFYGVIIISTILGMLINYIGIDPIKALVYSAIINGLAAPTMLVCIVLLSSSEKVMGKHKNSPLISVAGWGITLAMFGVAIATLWQLIN